METSRLLSYGYQGALGMFPSLSYEHLIWARPNVHPLPHEGLIATPRSLNGLKTIMRDEAIFRCDCANDGFQDHAVCQPIILPYRDKPTQELHGSDRLAEPLLTQRHALQTGRQRRGRALLRRPLHVRG